MLSKNSILSIVAVSLFACANFCSNIVFSQVVTESEIKSKVARGLDYLASTQRTKGQWTTGDGSEMYPCAMTGMAGTALLCEGSTTTQGKYSQNISKAVDYLCESARKNNSKRSQGLIGTEVDDRYTYGHGFGMLFLSQVLGEEENLARREELIEILEKAVEFTGNAQTPAGGWGYVSAKDGSNFDEGSTTITQVQALRGCRNAGVSVPKEIIEKAIKYIHRCSINGGAGGVQYNIHGGGGRPPISAAAIACLFNAGEYDDSYVPKLIEYCDKSLLNVNNSGGGYWHYAHYYYAQVKYRQGGKEWKDYRDKVYAKILKEANANGSWNGSNGITYGTSINLTILQLEHSALPIYQR